MVLALKQPFIAKGEAFLRQTLKNLKRKEAILWIWILLNAKEVNGILISELNLKAIKELLEEDNLVNLFNNLESKLRISVSKLYLKKIGVKIPLTGEVFKFRAIKLFSVERDKIEVVLSEFVYPLILEAKRIYDEESFVHQIKLRSKHSQVLYRFLKKHRNISLTVEELQ